MAHTADSTRSLFDIVRRYHQHVPEILKPPQILIKTRAFFDLLDGSFQVTTAGGDSVGRGETLTHIHAE